MDFYTNIGRQIEHLDTFKTFVRLFPEVLDDVGFFLDIERANCNQYLFFKDVDLISHEKTDTGYRIYSLLDNIETVYTQDGRLLSTGEVENGQREGYWKFYSPIDGSLTESGNYNNGVKTGRWISNNGDEKTEQLYRNGKVKETNLRYPSGEKKLYRTFGSPNGEDDEIEFFKNGNIKDQGKTITGRFFTGERKEFYENGTLKTIGSYVEPGTKTNHWIFFWPNGQKKEEGDYVGNLRSGEWVEYSETDGSIGAKGVYTNGKKNQKWVEFYPSGRKKAEIIYLDGVETSRKSYSDRFFG